jgi:hypothetical protein
MGAFLTAILVIFSIIGVLALFALIFFFSLAMAIQKDPEKFEKEFNEIYEKYHEQTYGEKPKEKAFTFKRRD